MGSRARLREIFGKILQTNLASVDQEIETLLHYTLRHDALDQTEEPREKAKEILNLLLDRGEEACQGCLENVRHNPRLFPGISHFLKETESAKAMFRLVVEELGLTNFLQHKLTLPYVQSIGCHELSEASCHSLKDIPMHFLRHLMALNIQEAFRSFDFTCEAEQDPPRNMSRSVHPLDVLCSLLHCSDNFLRQEIIRRMSMCQVPVPLLLPAGEDAHETFLLWAMSGITKRLSPSSDDHIALSEESVVNISLPVVSFVSLGECRCTSIDKIINHILTSTPKKKQNHFRDRVISWGRMPRYISDGLVEISWYFPADPMDLKPFAMTNLHGDLQSNMRQFRFLTKVSSAVFILLENTTRQQWDLLSHAGDHDRNYYFIVQDQVNQESRQLCSDFGLNEENILVESDHQFYEKLQSILKDTIQSSPKQMTLSEMSVVASKLNFCNDENQPGCEYGRLHALDLINDIVNEDIGEANQQQHLKQEIAIIEKELCQLKDQGGLPTADYKSKLINQMLHLRAAQSRYNYSDIMITLRSAFTVLSKVEQQYFLKWIQLENVPTNIQDVFCKVGQMYEAEVLGGSMAETTRLWTSLPKAAAELLLQGIPLELIDGDTTSMHLQWITDVLKELDAYTKGRCRIRVISILGVQSTGKSTLLNTMFGLQFPVARRQCTQGALISVIKVEERDLGCDFLLVIDCEGFRSLEKASEEENFDHDNELATLVVGLSDIAIINMALGSTSDMQNILQIVVHALLRMKGTGQKPNCVLVYQTMEGASSEEETTINHKTLRLGAQIDKSSRFIQYNDTIECNILEDYWVIPPFDPEISHYGEKVAALKQHLLHMIKSQSPIVGFRDMKSFAADIQALWNSVKHETFLFRFKNILEANVYTELYERFLELKWNLCRKMHRWWDRTSTRPPGERPTNTSYNQDVLRMLKEEVRAMEESLQVYFTDKPEDTNSNVAKRFEDEFMEMIPSVRSELESYYTNKCSQMKILRHGLANTIVEDFTQEEWDPDGTNMDVELYWNEAVTKYRSMLRKYNVETDFLQLLRQEMLTKGSVVTERIHSISNLSDYAGTTLTDDANYVNKSWFLEKCNHMENCRDCHNKWETVTDFLIEKSNQYVQKMSKSAYDLAHGMNLLGMVNEVIPEDNMPYTVLFKLDLKLQILAQTAPKFQQMQDDFLEECKVKYIVDHQRAETIHYLRCILQDKRTAKIYCQDWLKPAVEQKVKKMFTQKLADDYTNYMCVRMRSRRRTSEGAHGLRCLHHVPVEGTLENICSRYTDEEEIQGLLRIIISSVIEDVRNVLNPPDVLTIGNIKDLVVAVRSVVEERMSDVRGAVSNVTVPNVLQFASYLNFFVNKLEEQIQEEFSSKSIEELYTECPYRIY